MRGGMPQSPGDRNALEDLLGQMTQLERKKYPVSPEFRWLTIVTIALALLTTWVFPVLPETVDVGGWALWWLGGSITWVMEFVARYWQVEVALGGLALLINLYLVIASHGLRDAPKKLQWLMVPSAVLIVPNVLALVAVLVLWALVILIWAVIIIIVVGTLSLLVEKIIEAW